MQLLEKTFIHHGTDNLITFLPYHNEPLSKSVIDDVENHKSPQAAYNKRLNGLWACSYTPERKYKSAWEHFTISSRLRSKEELNTFILFKLREDSKVLVLDTFSDLLNLDSKYAYVKESTKKKELFEKLIHIDPSSIEHRDLLMEYYRENDIALLNADAISSDFDAIYVSELFINLGLEAFKLWSVESLVVFNLESIQLCNSSRNGGGFFE